MNVEHKRELAKELEIYLGRHYHGDPAYTETYARGTGNDEHELEAGISREINRRLWKKYDAIRFKKM